MTKFNAGDKVYCIAGRYLPKVYTLEDFDARREKSRPFSQ